MADLVSGPFTNFRLGLHELRRNWGWILALGIALIVLGMIAIGDVVLFTVVSVVFIGWMLVFQGVIEAVQAFRHRRGTYLFFHVVSAVLSVVVGILLLSNPTAGAVVLTLVLSIYFIVGGLFRIIAAGATRIHSWGWMVLNGVITLALGILVLAHWPSSAMWVLGLFIGIDFIVGGWSRVMLALAARRIPLATA
jgi:uncharacterized membrane protein HdeD (DUF308 family)